MPKLDAFNESEISIKPREWLQTASNIIDIRRKVFIEEQGVPENEEIDPQDSDNDTTHFLLSVNSQPVGTARVLASGQIGRMAILQQTRGQGLGLRLLRRVVDYALTRQFSLPQTDFITLHAQVQAIAFYEKAGFCAYGERFLDAGIEHQAMCFQPSKESFQQVYSDQVLRLEKALHYCQHITQIVSHASRSLDIFCDCLMPPIWAQLQVVDAVSTLARRSANSRIRILVQNPSSLAGTHHPIINLCRRLSSRSSIRVVNADTAAVEHAYAIADCRQLVYFNDEKTLNGFANYRAPAECQTLVDEFESIWNYNSNRDPNLEQVYL